MYPSVKSIAAKLKLKINATLSKLITEVMTELGIPRKTFFALFDTLWFCSNKRPIEFTALLGINLTTCGSTLCQDLIQVTGTSN
jgi:hypothetical protein